MSTSLLPTTEVLKPGNQRSSKSGVMENFETTEKTEKPTEFRRKGLVIKNEFTIKKDPGIKKREKK